MFALSQGGARLHSLSRLVDHLDDRVGEAVDEVVQARHARRLRRAGAAHALDPPAAGGLWAERTPPPRPGNSVRVLIDGAQALPRMAQAMQQAHSHIFIAGWCLTPWLQLTRGHDPVVLRSMLRELAVRVDVRVLLWAGAPLPVFRPWRPQVRDELCGDSVLHCALDDHERPLHTHHEKLIVIDDEIAFVGGIDLTDFHGDRFDTNDHPLRAGVGWHDVAMELRGPIVADVAEHLRFRWHEVTGATARALNGPWAAKTKVEGQTRVEWQRRRSGNVGAVANGSRYDSMQYRRCGHSGLKLPAISLGLWQNFGGERPFEASRAIVTRAFDLGVTHFDLANNYGPPYGSAEETFGRILRKDLAARRDELVVSTKAGYDMWPGPYGDWGSRKYLLASLDQSLSRMGLDYVDIFYSHRFDPETPLEETMGALDAAVRRGKALYVGISSYSAERTRAAAEILHRLGTPLLIHQPSYSLLNRWIERDLLGTLESLGVGCIAFSPLAQGLLTDRYLHAIPQDSRVVSGEAFSRSLLTEKNLARVRALAEVAGQRGQTLAQMALAWTLHDSRVTAALVGVSRIEQLESDLAALDRLEFTPQELAEIDRHAVDAGVDMWAESSRS